jgi:hypothetical protein
MVPSSLYHKQNSATSLRPLSPVLQLREIMVNLLLAPLVLLAGATLMLALAAVLALINRQPSWNTASGRQYGWITIATVALLLMLIRSSVVAVPHQVTAWSSLVTLIPPLTLQSNQPGRLLGLGFAAVVLAGFVIPRDDQRQDNGKPAGPTQPTGLTASEKEGALLIVVLAISLVTLLPADLLCLTLSWALLDGITAAAWLYAVRPRNNDQWRRVLLSWGGGAAATLLLWGATLPLQADFAPQRIPLPALAGWSGTALTLAILLRLAPFPFHILGGRCHLLGEPPGREQQSGLLIALQAAPAVAGIWLLGQLPAGEALPPLWHELIRALLLTGLVGCGLLAWLSRKEHQTVGWILTAQAGVVVLAGLSAGPEAALAEGMALLLAGGILTLYTQQENLAVENRIAGGLAVVALAGLPLTWGGEGRLRLYQSWLADGSGLSIFLAAGAYLLTTAAAARIVLRPAPTPLDREARIRVGVALGLPALGLLMPSASPAVQVDLPVWLAVLIPLGGGVFLAWSAPSLLPIQERTPPWLPQLLALDWLTSLIGQTGSLIGRAAQAVHQVLEAEGVLLWVLIGLALGWMLLTTQPPG